LEGAFLDIDVVAQRDITPFGELVFEFEDEQKLRINIDGYG